MSAAESMRDLVVLVADSDQEAALRALLKRHASFGVRPLDAALFRHPQRDAGCRLRAPEFLRPFISMFRHALVIFDYEGCGSHADPVSLEQQIELRLEQTGWVQRARVIVIEPELEAWVWNDSPKVDRALGWADRLPSLRTWLQSHGHLAADAIKPARPKEAMDAALREVRKPRSSATFAQLAMEVSFLRCVDRAFLRLRQTITEWFPATGAPLSGPPSSGTKGERRPQE